MKRNNKQRVTLYTKNKDLPATVGLVLEVREELKACISKVEHKIDARFSKVDERFNQIDARFSKVDERFNQIDARFSKMETRFSGMDAKFSGMDSRFSGIESIVASMDEKYHYMSVLMEQQKSDNRIVLDGLKLVQDRLGRLETRLEQRDVECLSVLRSLAQQKQTESRMLQEHDVILKKLMK